LALEKPGYDVEKSMNGRGIEKLEIVTRATHRISR
jgi:hypothetical protein